MKRNRLTRTLVVALGIVAALPALATADTSFPAAARELTAHGELLVWTPSDSPGQLWSGPGAAAPLPIPRARFASVDLGTDARGRVVLVYSACRIRRPRHCALHLYDFASRLHRRLSSLSRRGCSERAGLISRGVVVFERDCRGSSGRRRDGLYIKRPGQPERGIRGLPSGVQQPLGAPTLSSLDFAGNTLAYVERRVSDGPEESTWWVTKEVRVRDLGRRRSRLLARERKLESPSPAGTDIQQVQLDSGFAYWERDVITEGDPPAGVPYRQEIVRRPSDGSAPATELDRAGRLYVDPSPETQLGLIYDQLGRFAVSGDRLYYSYPVNGAFIGQVTGTPIFR